jgi:glycosyltransferase involved in cell wall biosynthesis
MSADTPSDAALALSVVVPVRNEAGNIAPLIAEIHAALAPLNKPYEIIYVDDGSDDATSSELKAAAAQDARLRVFRHRRSCGQSQATITGVVAARGTWIATLDGDGQNDPADLPKLLVACAAAADSARTLFIGQRMGRRDTAARVVASKIANAVRGALLNDGTRDSGCGLKLLRRDLFLALPRFNALHRFTPALVRRAGGRVVPVAISHRPRLRGISKYGIIGRGLIGIADLFGVFWLIRRNTLPETLEQ